MLDTIIDASTTGMSVKTALICTGTSIGLGIIISLFYMFRSKYTKSYIITLALLPALTQIVITLVNGNLGTGLAIMGAFSLVRFRSLPGDSKHILGVFYAMSIGLATGMGYITFAVLCTFIIGIMMIILEVIPFAEKGMNDSTLRIVIPEDADYDELFSEILKKYTKKCNLERVRTVNMGTMYEVNYRIVMKNEKQLKDMMDEIRVRNGNLTVNFFKVAEAVGEL